MVEEIIATQVRSLLMTLWEAERKPSVRAWAIHVALTFAINKYPEVNKRDIWKLIQDEYTANLQTTFPNQREPGQSYRRASGDAWEMFVEEYLNSNDVLRKEGIRAIRLSGEDFTRLVSSLGAQDLRPRDVDFFLQGVTDTGTLQIFGALFPKASYAERIRTDETASRRLMEKGLWCATVTLDAREELGTDANPSVKRRTINSGAFNGCYSFNEHTNPGNKVHIVRCTERGNRNPLIRDIIQAWRSISTRNSTQ